MEVLAPAGSQEAACGRIDLPRINCEIEVKTTYQHICVPPGADKITLNADFSLSVPDNPIVTYIEGDGIGADITPAMVSVVDAARNSGFSLAAEICSVLLPVRGGVPVGVFHASALSVREVRG